MGSNNNTDKTTKNKHKYKTTQINHQNFGYIVLFIFWGLCYNKSIYAPENAGGENGSQKGVLQWGPWKGYPDEAGRLWDRFSRKNEGRAAEGGMLRVRERELSMKRSKRVEALDQRKVNLDGFIDEGVYRHEQPL